MRLLNIIVFVAIVLTVWTGMHLLVYFRLAQLFDLSSKQRLLLKLLLLLLAMSVIVGEFLSHRYAIHGVNTLAYVWMGVVSLLFFLLLILIPVNWLRPAWNPSLGKTVLYLTLVVSIWGLINHAIGHRITPVRLDLMPASWPHAKFKIVQLSDLHLLPDTSISRVKKIVDDTLAQKPDLIVITGDIIERPIAQESPICREFARLNAPSGVFAISGNHEAYIGLDWLDSFVSSTGIRLLNDQRIDLGEDLTLIGFHDDEFIRQGVSSHTVQLGLLDKLSAKRLNILLYHRPTHFEEHKAKGVNLQLSGHTHAGQILPMGLIVYFYYRYPFGLHQENGHAIYTSKGTGVWGPPMRFPCRSELTVITLEPQK